MLKDRGVTKLSQCDQKVRLLSWAGKPRGQEGLYEGGKTMKKIAATRSISVATFTGLTITLLALPAWAIPSPDLLINFSASAAQLLGILSVMVGGFAYQAGGHPSYRTERRRQWRWVFRGALICLAISVGLNIYQYTRQMDADNARLRFNLVRPSIEEGKQVGDVSLKTLSYSQQLQHPLGLSTERLAKWIGEKKSLNLIDIREPEEVEKGQIRGSWHIRYPDLRNHPEKLVQPGAETVLLCFSGNRSSELCQYFTEQGYSCHFMVGGYEKWLAENRPLIMATGRTAEELRELPDFPNKDVLLDTEQVLKRVQEEQAVFVDVRYPGDFERGHLPGAINLPIRKLPSRELDRRLRALPKDRPIIAPCYDKRSCFYAQILGIRLSRLGYDFRGRYTLPHEFYLPRQDKSYVAHWRENQQGRSLLDWVAQPLEAVLLRLDQATGHILIAILMMVAALRLGFLPWTLKAERDQLMQRHLAPRVQALKQRFSDDAPQASRAVMRLYRRNGLTPMRNMVASLLQIGLFLVLFRVVQKASGSHPQSFLWIANLGEPDPLHLLPVTVALALFGYLWFSVPHSGTARRMGYAVFAAAIGALAWRLNAAVNLYLLVGIAVISLQSVLARRRFRNELVGHDEPRFPAPSREDPGIVPLAEAHHYAGSGNKAIRLGQMMAMGLPVPDGFVICDRVLSRPGEGLILTEDERERIKTLWGRLRCDQVAVRSSGVNEDGEQQSYAGVFESKLGVSWDELPSSLEAVRLSFSSRRAGAYAGQAEEPAGIVVQKMVAAEFAGVLFTEHPATTGCMLVEMVAGLGESLVSGTATPRSYRYGRLSGRLLESEGPSIELEPLLQLGRRVEQLFGRPQDIEWAYAEGRFYLLQARDITASSAERDDIEAERGRLLSLFEGIDAETPVLVQNELSELLPRPTPLSFSLMQRLWAPGGSTDLACRILGVPYDVDADSPPLLVTVFGYLYLNRPESRRRVGKGPGAGAAFRLSRGADWIERDFRQRFLPLFQRQMRLHEALDFGRLEAGAILELLQDWVDDFVRNTYVQAEVINVAADFYWKTACRQLEKAGLDPARYLTVSESTVVHRAMNLLVEAKQGRGSVEAFLQLFGHRAPNDYELAQARYQEDPRLVQALCQQVGDFHGICGNEIPKGRVVRLAVERARRYQCLKEEAKHDCLRQLANLRRLLIDIGSRFGLDDGIFHLTLDEVLQLGQHREALGARLKQRLRLNEAWASIELPAAVSIGILETLGMDTVPSMPSSHDALKGLRVAGEGDVIGPVQVVRDPRDIDTFRDGHILVARFTDPTWTPLFNRAKGLITEVGGWLSHAAIVAREFNLTAIVGVSGSTEQLNDGELVRLGRDGTVVKLTDRRIDPRLPATIPLTVIQGGRTTEARLRDLSRGGACIQTGTLLQPGETIELESEVLDRTHTAEVVRITPDGHYGLRFLQPLKEVPEDQLIRSEAA